MEPTWKGLGGRMSAPRFGITFWIRGLERKEKWKLYRFMSATPGSEHFSLKDNLQKWINDGTIDKIDQYFDKDEMRKDFVKRFEEEENEETNEDNE